MSKTLTATMVTLPCGGGGGETAPTVSTAQVPSLVQSASADVKTFRQNEI